MWVESSPIDELFLAATNVREDLGYTPAGRRRMMMLVRQRSLPGIRFA